ncbi:MAG: hypothetical protein IT440_09440 [Phycisphaeraceae bacterium]|nr:hypothetical protein [Phycisphaeraceae bacterium]
MNRSGEVDTSDLLSGLIRTPFDQLDWRLKTRCFGVDYVHLEPPEGGELFVTRHGWQLLPSLMPAQWFVGQKYQREGERLPGATAAVYRFPSRNVLGRPLDLVIKFSRVGQEVPLVMAASFPERMSDEVIANARFNSPFEEFGQVMELRQGRYGPADVNLLAQRPLAIYVTPGEHALWRLGRTKSRFTAHERRMAVDQAGAPASFAIELDIKREYVVIYSWIKGENAEQMQAYGLISDVELQQLTARVIHELSAKGFRVLDNKPKHFILQRERKTGRLLRHHGNLAYALIDFELLERTEEYKTRFRTSQRARYWRLLRSREDPLPKRLPEGLHEVDIFGVRYIFGVTPNGGKLWVVGHDPELFDFFLPDRWRRTPRTKLSSVNEVYRTRTRDNIHVVYRRSRIGEKPHVDPFYEQGQRIREYGFNSPFEEVALAQRLRHQGIRTAFARAIYRTGHESTEASYLRDPSRYNNHRHILPPEETPQTILDPDHDFYTLWGLWRGILPADEQGDAPLWGIIDVPQAFEEELISQPEYRRIIEDTTRRLSTVGLTELAESPSSFLMSIHPDGRHFRRDNDGRYLITLCFDSLRALDTGLLTDRRYRHLVDMARQRLTEAGCEPLNLQGDHLLLTLDPDGRLKCDAAAELDFTVCNFELIQMP